VSEERQAAPAASGEKIRVPVWDWPIRAFHWAITALMVVSVVTITIGGDAKLWHMRAGYALLALVLFRIVWGFVGPRHARFAGFVRGPGAVLAYLKDLSRGTKKVYVGHNPLGGWSVVALLALLLLQAGTGLFANDDVITEGPLARLVSKDLSDSITWFHRRNGWALWTLVGIHVAAVLYYLLALKEDLIRPMITGAKTLPPRFVDSGFGSARSGTAVVLLALAAFAVWWLVR
jgi:cytochrome b